MSSCDIVCCVGDHGYIVEDPIRYFSGIQGSSIILDPVRYLITDPGLLCDKDIVDMVPAVLLEAHDALLYVFHRRGDDVREECQSPVAALTRFRKPPRPNLAAKLAAADEVFSLKFTVDSEYADTNVLPHTIEHLVDLTGGVCYNDDMGLWSPNR